MLLLGLAAVLLLWHACLSLMPRQGCCCTQLGNLPLLACLLACCVDHHTLSLPRALLAPSPSPQPLTLHPSLHRSFLAKCVEDIEAEAAKNRVEDEEEGEDLCNCEFSLAYGAKILLNNATMRLKRGKRYGLCGPNGVGKSTLMRAIVNGQVDGFPPKEQVGSAAGLGPAVGAEQLAGVMVWRFCRQQSSRWPAVYPSAGGLLCIHLQVACCVSICRWPAVSPSVAPWEMLTV